MKMTPQGILDTLGGLPKESEHCALLAIITIRDAVKEYLDIKRDPWKKAYKKK